MKYRFIDILEGVANEHGITGVNECPMGGGSGSYTVTIGPTKYLFEEVHGESTEAARESVRR